MQNQRLWIIVIAAILACGTLFVVWQFAAPTDGQSAQSVIVPDLSQRAESGRIAYDNNCAQCHGQNGSGTGSGPTLIHKIYEPSHHRDASFFSAAERGVQQHHWPFGDMPPQPQVSREEMGDIIQYIRELQRANGIT